MKVLVYQIRNLNDAFFKRHVFSVDAACGPFTHPQVDLFWDVEKHLQRTGFDPSVHNGRGSRDVDGLAWLDETMGDRFDFVRGLSNLWLLNEDGYDACLDVMLKSMRRMLVSPVFSRESRFTDEQHAFWDARSMLAVETIDQYRHRLITLADLKKVFDDDYAQNFHRVEQNGQTTIYPVCGGKWHNLGRCINWIFLCMSVRATPPERRGLWGARYPKNNALQWVDKVIWHFCGEPLITLPSGERQYRETAVEMIREMGAIIRDCADAVEGVLGVPGHFVVWRDVADVVESVPSGFETFGFTQSAFYAVVDELMPTNSSPPIPGFAPEPPPKPGEGDVWQEIIDSLNERLADALDGVCSDGPPDTLTDLLTLAKARQGEGKAKYGTPLQRNNGRNHWIDAMQEALDLAVYLQAADPGSTDVRRSLDLACACAVRGGVLPGRTS